MTNDQAFQEALEEKRSDVIHVEGLRLVEGCLSHALAASKSVGNPFLNYLLGMAQYEISRMLMDEVARASQKNGLAKEGH